MKAREWIGLILVVAVIAGGGYLAANRFIQSQPRICPLSNRPIEPRLAYTLTLEQGKTMTVCCPRCAIRYELGRPTEVRSRLATDYETRQRFQAENGYYVEGSDVVHCNPSPAPLREMQGGAYGMTFDRCLPSLVAFETEDRAQAFQQEHGGLLLRYPEAVARVEQQ